ncbi:MAG TPA: hypothetical protein DCM05_06475 [Elusimicrobia bacterium]|nr:hypothetical protein [Elusimicrobiota bacterium]
MTLRISFLKKGLAAGLSAAILTLSPGIEGYRLFAQVHTQAVSIGNAVQGGQAGAALTGGGFRSRIQLDASSLKLNAGVLPGVTAVAPTVKNLQAAAPAALPRTIQVQQAAAARSFQTAPSASQQAPIAAEEAAVAKTNSQTLKTLVSDPRSVALPVEEIERMPASQAREAGAAMMDRVLGAQTIKGSAQAEAPVEAAESSRMGSLLQAPEARSAGTPSSIESAPVQAEETQAPKSMNRGVRAAIAVARIAASAAAVVGLQTAAATLLPAVFGLVPVAALWAISSGVLLLPIAVYSRYRLGLRDSPRLGGLKLAFDLFIGAFLGAAAIAAPAFLGGAALTHLALAMPLVTLASFAAARAGEKASADGASVGIIDKVLAWAALNLLAPIMGTAAAGPLTLGAMFGLMALPAMTTVSFFLGFLIRSAETGRPFHVPGSQQKIRFPAYTWVMTGVVFALLTGFSPVWTNVAFALWMFAGSSRIFDIAYGAVALWAAATGFAAPVSFLAIAFAPERAATWTERLLEKLFPARQAAPSTEPAPERSLDYEKPAKWPAFRFWVRTGLAIGGIVALSAAMSAAVFPMFSFLKNLAFVGVLTGLQVYFSRQMIKKVMKTEPTDAQKDPEVFSIMTELRGIINRNLEAKGKKPIPMPEIINVSMGVPNAFATGMSPNKAMVGVTFEIKQMLLEPETLRAGLLRLVALTNPASKSFAVFRTAMRGSIAGVADTDGPAELQAALGRASEAELKALGTRALRGVLGHEFSHVMNRDMIIGATAGSLSSAISFSSYGVLWAVGHAKAALKKLKEILFDRTAAAKTQSRTEGPRALVDPGTAGAAITAAAGLLKIFAALWGPILASILQMASSRVREGGADEDGALLTSDPAALAIGLGLLTTWQPPAGFVLPAEQLPLVAANAHLMTVNPVEQLYRSGALPEFDPMLRLAVGKEDNFFFNLFITHPDTTLRIERLYDMQRALEAGASR